MNKLFGQKNIVKMKRGSNVLNMLYVFLQYFVRAKLVKEQSHYILMITRQYSSVCLSVH